MRGTAEARASLYLKEYKMDEIKNKLRPTEPKVSVGNLHERYPLNYGMPFFNFKSHLGYDCLKLRSNC